jgi:hypothetical protein
MSVIQNLGGFQGARDSEIERRQEDFTRRQDVDAERTLGGHRRTALDKRKPIPGPPMEYQPMSPPDTMKTSGGKLTRLQPCCFGADTFLVFPCAVGPFPQGCNVLPVPGHV